MRTKLHPKSHETFLIIEGGVVIKFEPGEYNLIPAKCRQSLVALATVQAPRATGLSI